MAISHVPEFSVRWTEPLGIRTRQHELAVNIVGESLPGGPTGSVRAITEDNLGPIPAGSRIGSGAMIDSVADAAPVADIWSQVKADSIERWLTPAEAGGRLGRRELELVVRPQNGPEQAYRSSIDDAPQPVRDLVAAAAHVHADVRLHGRTSA